MISAEDIKRLNLVETLKEEIKSLKEQLKEKDDLLKQEIQYKIQERKKWQANQT